MNVFDHLPALLTSGSLLAIPLVFVAGIVTSAGPCTATRFLAVSTYAARSRRPAIVIAFFVAGLVGAHIPLGIAAAIFRQAVYSVGAFTTVANVAFVVVFAATGIFMIVRPSRSHVHDEQEAIKPRSLAGIFALGAGFAIAVGPCCLPGIAVILAATTFAGKPIFGTFLLCIYAAGHAVPVFALGPFTRTLQRLGDRFALAEVGSVAAGSAMICLAGVYGLCI